MISIKKRTSFLFFLPFVMFSLSSCKPEFSINSDGEPFPVIYGLLNPSEKVHYVKVYKSFVVEGSAYDVVKDIHMYSYIDSIEVYLNEYDSRNNLIREIKLDTSTAIAKDSGIFLYPTQILYATDTDAVLNKDYLYEITVFNPYTKNRAKTKAPLSLAGQVNLTVPKGTDISITDRPLSFEFYTGQSTTMYQLVLKYYYTEDLFDNTSRQPSPVVWGLGSLNDLTAEAGSLKKLSLSTGANFFSTIAESINNNDASVKSRHTDSIVVEVYSAGKDWGLYIQSNLPSTGINQDRLQYSNMIAYNTETGEEKYTTGIFSSRGVTRKTYNDLTIIGGSRDSLLRGRYTGHLKFTDIY